MARGRLGAEQIVTKLRQIEVLQGQGKCVAAACKEAETTEHTYYRRRKEYGGLNVDQAKRLAHCCADAAPVAIANVGGASSILIAGCVIW